MKPWETLGEALAPDGTRITLARRDTEYVILANGQLLMTNRMHTSEETLAAVGKTIWAATGTERTLIDDAISNGKVLDAALV